METLKRTMGIQAIIDLQALAGIEESRENAEKAWDGMSPHDRDNTMAAHAVLVSEPAERKRKRG